MKKMPSKTTGFNRRRFLQLAGASAFAAVAGMRAGAHVEGTRWCFWAIRKKKASL